MIARIGSKECSTGWEDSRSRDSRGLPREAEECLASQGCHLGVMIRNFSVDPFSLLSRNGER